MAGSIVKNLAYKVNHGDLDVKVLAKIIDKAYAAMNEPQFKRKTTFAPSGIGFGHGKCPRYWHIAFDGAMFIETRRGQDYANMQTGTDAHERIGKVLENSDLDIIAIEQEFTHDDPPIRGFIDGIVDRNGQEVIVEIKTTRTEAFRARQASMTPPDYHLLQILIYMYLRGAESGFFLYEDKNTHEMLIMPVYMDDTNRQIVESALDWMRNVRKHYDDGKLPEIPYRSNSKVCKSCPVRDTCFSDKYGKGDVHIDPLDIV